MEAAETDFTSVPEAAGILDSMEERDASACCTETAQKAVSSRRAARVRNLRLKNIADIPFLIRYLDYSIFFIR